MSRRYVRIKTNHNNKTYAVNVNFYPSAVNSKTFSHAMRMVFLSCWSLLLFYLIFMITGSQAKPPPPLHPPRLLVVSYDGFRYDYFDRNVVPFLKELKFKGIFADHMRNVFVTKTFPNHHTISTGLYVESHGVVDSEFFDEKLNKTIKYSEELYHYNNDILPIWAINENSGEGRRSGVMMWPGSVFQYRGISASFKTVYNIHVPWTQRIDELISWFKHPKTPINFGMLYIEEPDFHGHGIGINSVRFNNILTKLDNITKYLHNKLKQNCLTDVNVIHLSDHGMATVTIDKIINLTNYIDPNDCTFSGLSPVINIYPHKGKENIIYNNLKKASEIYENFDVYLKEDIPVRYHFSNNTRVGPILVVAKVGYGFDSMYASFPWYEKEFNITINEKSEFGVHGYDNNNTEMYPFFFGVGPAFLPHCEVEPFDNIDLVPLFCEILEVPCEEVNGTIGNLKNCLTKHREEEILYKGIYIGGVVISIVGIIILFLIHLRRKRIQRHDTKYRILIDEAILENQLSDKGHLVERSR